MDNIIQTGEYHLLSTKHPANVPSGLLPTASTKCFVNSSGRITIQELFPIVGEPFYRVRYDEKWYNWCRLTTDTPSFYKNYNSTTELKDALDGIFSAIPDGGLDEIDVQGLHIYSPISETAGGKGLGAVIHLQRSARNNSNCVALQIGVWRDYNGVWFREAIGANASFASWHKLAEEN